MQLTESVRVDLTPNSHSVEISIAGCVEDMVRDPNPMPFFFSSFFFFIFNVFFLLGTKSACSASYGMKNPSISNQQVPGKKPSTHIPLVWNQQPHQPRKIGNQSPTKRTEQENQINTWGGINRKTLAVDTNNKINNCYNHL